jgi:hypothetical protein
MMVVAYLIIVAYRGEYVSGYGRVGVSAPGDRDQGTGGRGQGTGDRGRRRGGSCASRKSKEVDAIGVTRRFADTPIPRYVFLGPRR